MILILKFKNNKQKKKTSKIISQIELGAANPEKINYAHRDLNGHAHIKQKINLHEHIQIKQVLKSLQMQRSKVFKWDFLMLLSADTDS